MTYPFMNAFAANEVGFHLGKSAFFVRLHGCQCIARGAILQALGIRIRRMVMLKNKRNSNLADEAFMACPEIVVITGGEACRS